MAHPSNAGCFHDNTSNMGAWFAYHQQVWTLFVWTLFLKAYLYKINCIGVHFISVHGFAHITNIWQLDSSRVRCNRNTYNPVQHRLFTPIWHSFIFLDYSSMKLLNLLERPDCLFIQFKLDIAFIFLDYSSITLSNLLERDAYITYFFLHV